MSKGRLEAFSDGVIAIIITIMVLELKVPHGEDLQALRKLIPTGWMGENHFAEWPVALYGVVLLMCGVAYYFLVRAILAHHGKESRVATALGRDFKGKVSVLIYLVAIPFAFVNRWAAGALYVLVAMVWFIPDSRIERRLAKD